MSNSIGGGLPPQTPDLTVGQTQTGQTQTTTLPTVTTVTLPTVGTLQNVQGQGRQEIPEVQPNELRGRVQEGTCAKIARWFKEGSIRLKGDAGLPAQITINHPSIGEARYSAKELKSFINTLPRLERQAARENLVAHLTARIARGSEIANSVLNGSRDNVNPSLQDVSDLMLFLDAKAHATGNGFSEGAYSIEDPMGKLYQFLDRCPEKYQRASSHLQAEQNSQVDGHLNTHRGIDIPLGTNGLPNGKKTILFAGIPEKGDVLRHIFIKPESHGCRLGSPSAQLHRAGATNFPDRPVRFFSDLKNTIGHGLSYFQAQGNKTTELLGATTVRKERISPAVIDAFNLAKAHISAFEDEIPSIMRAKAEVLQILDKNSPTDDDKGIHTMIQNFKEAMYLVKNETTSFESLQDAIDEAILIFSHEAAPHLKEVNNLGVRIGDEVIFSAQEIQNPTTERPVPAHNTEKSIQLATACTMTQNDAIGFIMQHAITSIPEALGINNATPAQLESVKNLLNNNPAGGAMTVTQMVENLKGLPAIFPSGILKNMASSHTCTALASLMPHYTMDGVDNNKEKLRNILTSMMPNKESWTAAQRTMTETIAKPALLLAMSNSFPGISASINKIINLPDDADSKTTSIALNEFYTAVNSSVAASSDSGDDTGNLLEANLKFAFAAFSKDQQTALYTKLSTPEAQTERAHVSTQVLALRQGANNTSYSSLMGNHGDTIYTFSAIVDVLEDSLKVPQQQRLNGDTDEVINGRLTELYTQNSVSAFKQTPSLEGLTTTTIDGKRAIAFEDALAHSEELIPHSYQIDSQRGMHLKIAGQRDPLDTTEKLFNAFSLTGEDGKKYLNIDLMRSVTSLACQETFRPLQIISEAGFHTGTGVMLMNTGDLVPHQKLEMVFNPENMQMKALLKQGFNAMLMPDGSYTPLKNSSTQLETNLTLNPHEDGSYSVNVRNAFVDMNWRT